MTTVALPARDDVQYWTTAAAALRIRRDAWIDGRAVASVDGQRRDTMNPATGAVLAEVAECGAADIDLAVRAARRSFEDGRWSRRAPRERQATLRRLADLILEHTDELALLDTVDAGKTIADTTAIDVPGTAAILRWYADLVDKVPDEVAPTGEGELALVRREPLGVVAAVVPWNYPLEMAMWKLAPALASGNSVVLKPAEESPLSVLRLAELATEAGLPDGVLNVVPGAGPVAGRALGVHPDVDVVAFTGSTPVGKLFLQYAGQSNLKQVWPECGGKSANLVFADTADLDAAADGVIAGIFTNQGQVCSANSRLLVERSIHDDLLARVVTRASTIAVGDPLDPATSMGPLVSRRQAERVRAYIETGRGEATLVHGDGIVAGATSDAFVAPTIFSDVAPGAVIATEEIFGPVLAVMPFDNEDEAIALANDSVYGLAASVWSDRLSRVHRIAPRLRAGTVSVNTVDAIDVGVPFGGFGQSGFGRDLSAHALDKFTALKTTWIKHS
ncbi:MULTISPECIES: aldehyde dehydrogenase [unclassified Curtobacterium]|jgi:gamma-glutamyl-gamma-aminobutyraldehyde dehydrogenase|uniref:aldehyde dehydrogenase n=1 Tax=unclassified Curtobacterium TaxID=257496 RepID=UPI00286391EB|nr:aldehyde dehydrogenase [Curtobacterium sp. 320]MDR6573601.1 gamma-glutamyl-gamma-aminobutyraldehyde dehydrogenase [Curtobacterium sp. 320]